MKRFLVIITMLASTVFTACTDEEVDPSVSEYEQIEGTWVIESQSLLGADVPGDGSSLTFNFCGIDTPCDGVDYSAAEETSGTFNFRFSEDNTKIIFEDNDSEAGGYYNGEWTIDEFTATRMTIWVDTGLFGVTTIRLVKQ